MASLSGRDKFEERGDNGEKGKTRRLRWSIIGVYVGESIERVLQSLEKWGEGKEKNEYVLIGGILWQGWGRRKE